MSGAQHLKSQPCYTEEGVSGGHKGGHFWHRDSAHGPGTGYNDNGQNEHLQWAKAPRSGKKMILSVCAILTLLWGQKDLQGLLKNSAGKVSGLSSWPAELVLSNHSSLPPICTTFAMESTWLDAQPEPQGAHMHAHRLLTLTNCLPSPLTFWLPPPCFSPVSILSFVS